MATLSLFGNTYELRSEEPDDDLGSVIEYVHEMARQAQMRGGSLPPHRIQVLMILNMAQEVLRLRKELNSLKERCAVVSANLIARIDSIIDGDLEG